MAIPSGSFSKKNYCFSAVKTRVYNYHHYGIGTSKIGRVWGQFNIRNKWMNKWMNDWMNKWTKKRTDKWMHERTSEQTNKWMNEWMNEWIRKNAWMNHKTQGSSHDRLRPSTLRLNHRAHPLPPHNTESIQMNGEQKFCFFENQI